MGPNEGLTTWWTRPRTWRKPGQASTPYWVEEEVLVLRDQIVVDRLSWSEGLDPAERERYDEALREKARLLDDRRRPTSERGRSAH